MRFSCEQTVTVLHLPGTLGYQDGDGWCGPRGKGHEGSSLGGTSGDKNRVEVRNMASPQGAPVCAAGVGMVYKWIFRSRARLRGRHNTDSNWLCDGCSGPHLLELGGGLLIHKRPGSAPAASLGNASAARRPALQSTEGQGPTCRERVQRGAGTTWQTACRHRCRRQW